MDKQSNFEQLEPLKPIELLLFGCPKPFIGPFIGIQQNAIRSWKQLDKVDNDVNVHVYLFGDEHNVNLYASQLRCTHIPHIKKNSFGTPLVNDIFKQIKTISLEYQSIHPNKTVVCCYINADIIVFDGFVYNIKTFLEAKNRNIFLNDIPSADLDRWLLVGMRWDTPNVPLIDFKDCEWSNKIIKYAKDTGESHGCWGIDYFIFGPNTFNFIYPFALGKFVWDRWLVGNVFRQDSVTVDISQSNFAIHQNGDWYQACTGGITCDRKALFDTEEVTINQSFDYYEKDVSTGTQWETVINKNGCIEFVLKENVPRNY